MNKEGVSRGDRQAKAATTGCKKEKGALKIAYINMQGGRKQKKLIEIRMQLGEGDFEVYAITETHVWDWKNPQ